MTNKGISGRSFLLLALFGLGSIFFFSVWLSGDLTSLAQTWTAMIQEVIAKLVLLIGFTIALAYLLFTHVLDAPVKQWRVLFTDRSNASYITLLTFIFLTGVFWLMGGSGADFSQYLNVLIQEGSLSLIISMVMIYWAARFVGIKSMDDFRDEIRAPHTNSYAFFVGGVLAGIMLLMMNV